MRVSILRILYIVYCFSDFIPARTYLANRTDDENNAKVDYFSTSKFKYFIKQTMNYSFDGTTNFRVAPSDRSMTLISLWKS